MKTIHVNTGVPYDILIEKGILKQAGKRIGALMDSRHTVIVTDDIVNRLYTDSVLSLIHI